MMDSNENDMGFIGESSKNGGESSKKAKNSPKVEFQIHPPITYKISSQKLGSLILELPIEKDDNLGKVLIRLYNGENEGWRELFDIQEKKMRPPIRTLINGKAISPTVFAQTPLKDGDKVSFMVIYGGG